MSLRSRSGARLAGVLELPAGATLRDVPTVVLCHGMESTKEGTKHRALSSELSARGYACLRFDFSFVGESGGVFEDLTIGGEVEDLAGACDHLWDAGVREIGLVGSSLGGTVAVLYAGREPRVRALATIAAVAHTPGIVERLPLRIVHAWRETGFREWDGRRLGSGFLDDLERQDVLAAAACVRSATLVTHGSDDRVVPASEATLLHDVLPSPKKLVITPGCDHRYSDPAHLRGLLDAIEGWITRHLPSNRARSAPADRGFASTPR